MCIFSDLLGEGEEEAEEPGGVPPQRVGDYELLQEIARGGMGVVWRAHHGRLNRRVALKFVLPGALPGETVARRFRQEAEVAAQLSHPHIITIHEVGEADGRYFISMELAEGGTLAQRLQQGRFEPRAAAELVGKLARAVQHAHDRGVLHRDLKPGNILFDGADEPRVSDFGLAQLAADRDALTVTGAVLGTPSYMSPEQARGEAKNLTTACDVYGLGSILYEALAGRPAFAGDVPLEVLRRVADEDPPPLGTGQRDLETICRKCLAKLPGDRYRSASTLADDLDRWLAGEPILARRAPLAERFIRWMRRRPALAALSLALAAAVISSAILLIAAREREAEARGAAAASELESQHRRADQHTTAAILALDREDSLRALPSLAAAIRTGTGDAMRDRVNRIRFDTTLRLAPRLEQAWFPGWVWDAQLYAAQERVLLCDGGFLRLLNTKDGSDAVTPMAVEGRLVHAALHPRLNRAIAEERDGRCSVWDILTGKRLVAVPGHCVDAPFLFAGGEDRLALWDGPVVRRYSLARCADDGPALTHATKIKWAYLCEGGGRILTFAADLKLRVWDAETGAAVGQPVPAPEDARLQGGQSGTGIVYVSTQMDRPGWLMDVKEGRVAARTASNRNVRAAEWVDGHLVVAKAHPNGFTVMGDADGGVLVTANHGVHGNDAAFSGNGLRVFTRGIDGGSRLWNLQTGRALTPLLWEGSDPLYNSLDAAGSYVLVSSREPALRLWHIREYAGAVSESVTPTPLVVDLLQKLGSAGVSAPGPFYRAGKGGHPHLKSGSGDVTVLHVINAVTGKDAVPPLHHQSRIIDAIFSPNGRHIASYTDNQCAYLWDAATGEQTGPLLRHDHPIDFLAFSPDSSLLFSVGKYKLQLWESATGTLASPPMVHPDPIRRAQWSDDGRRIISVDETGRQRVWIIEPEDRTVADLETLGHLYSAHRVTTGGALVPISIGESRAAWEAARKIPVP